jgi:hypothetical protein
MVRTMWKYSTLGIAALTVVGLTVLVAGQGAPAGRGGAPAGQAPAAPKQSAELQANMKLGVLEGIPSDPILKGAFDIHEHGDPDANGIYSGGQAVRRYDVLDMARRAKAAGMRGFVFKEHMDQTAGYAYLARKEVGGIEVFGGVGLNLAVGGLNHHVIEHMSEEVGGWGRIVWMPTWDSEWYVKGSIGDGPPAKMGQIRPFVTSSKNGQLVPEYADIFKDIATLKTRDSKGDLILATGHLKPSESLMVLQQAKAAGVKTMIFTHAQMNFIGATTEECLQAVKLGAYIEQVGFEFVPEEGPAAQEELHKVVELIRAVGVDHIVMASDVGQVGRPYHADTLSWQIRSLRAAGFSEQELKTLYQVNPAKIMSLAPLP